MYIINGERKDPAGGIFLNDQILKELEDIARRNKCKSGIIENCQDCSSYQNRRGILAIF